MKNKDFNCITLKLICPFGMTWIFAASLSAVMCCSIIGSSRLFRILLLLVSAQNFRSSVLAISRNTFSLPAVLKFIINSLAIFINFTNCVRSTDKQAVSLQHVAILCQSCNQKENFILWWEIISWIAVANTDQFNDHENK